MSLTKAPEFDERAFQHPQPQQPIPTMPGSPEASIVALNQRIDELEQLIQRVILTHHHDGVDSQQIRLATDVLGMFQVVSAAPTTSPHSIFDQVKIYVNGATYRLYLYDYNGQAWHYVALT